MQPLTALMVVVDPRWMKRNAGCDPKIQPAPQATFAHAAAAKPTDGAKRVLACLGLDLRNPGN